MNTTELPNVAELLMKTLSAGDRSGVKHSLEAAFAPEAFERRSLDQVQASWTPEGEESDWTVIMLSNYDAPVMQDFSQAALRYLALR